MLLPGKARHFVRSAELLINQVKGRLMRQAATSFRGFERR